jgi:hypothetical protein
MREGEPPQFDLAPVIRLALALGPAKAGPTMTCAGAGAAAGCCAMIVAWAAVSGAEEAFGSAADLLMLRLAASVSTARRNA